MSMSDKLDNIPSKFIVIKLFVSILHTIVYLDSSFPNVEYTENKIETIYFTNNNISGKNAEPTQHNSFTTDSVFNASFDFLQVCNNLNL